MRSPLQQGIDRRSCRHGQEWIGCFQPGGVAVADQPRQVLARSGQCRGAVVALLLGSSPRQLRLQELELRRSARRHFRLDACLQVPREAMEGEILDPNAEMEKLRLVPGHEKRCVAVIDDRLARSLQVLFSGGNGGPARPATSTPVSPTRTDCRAAARSGLAARALSRACCRPMGSATSNASAKIIVRGPGPSSGH